jgi:hypothetical protein
MATTSRPFFNFWRTRASFIEKLDPNENFYEANVLTWAVLDALAGCWATRFHSDLKRGRDRRRMGDFLFRYGGNPFQRVSLPTLWALSDDPKLTCASDVLQRLRGFGGRRKPSVIEEREARMLANDPLETEVLRDLANIEGVIVKRGDTVRDLVLRARFGEIAYEKMRCPIIHEGRLGQNAHGFKFGAESDDGPTYLSNVFAVPPSIGFAPSYMAKVIGTCTDGFEKEAEAANIDPVPKLDGCMRRPRS